QTLNDYSQVSDLAKDYVKTVTELEMKATELKVVFQKEQTISQQYQEHFINLFRRSLNYISASDSMTLEQLKTTQIKGTEDIDQLLLFMKRSYVKNLSGTDRYLFNMIGTSAEVENLNIKNGDTFSVTMNI